MAGTSPVSKSKSPKLKRAEKKDIGNYTFSQQYAIIQNDEKVLPVPMPIMMSTPVPVAYPINTSKETIVSRPSPLLNQ